MHKKIPNEEFEEDNDHSILPINHSTLVKIKKINIFILINQFQGKYKKTDF